MFATDGAWWLRWCLRAVVELLFPPRCAACGRGASGPLCGECLGQLEAVPRWACPRCADPGLAPAARGGPCKRCRAEPPAFTRLHVGWLHGGPLAAAIARWKYRGRDELDEPLAGLLLPAGLALERPVDALVPLPSTTRRRRGRGGDPVRRLTRELGRRLGLPVRPGWLVRRRDEGASAGRSRAARALPAGTFAADVAVEGLRVALVDDVVTTTATCRAAAEALRRAGASEVVVIALARAGGGP